MIWSFWWPTSFKEHTESLYWSLRCSYPEIPRDLGDLCKIPRHSGNYKDFKVSVSAAGVKEQLLEQKMLLAPLSPRSIQCSLEFCTWYHGQRPIYFLLFHTYWNLMKYKWSFLYVQWKNSNVYGLKIWMNNTFKLWFQRGMQGNECWVLKATFYFKNYSIVLKIVGVCITVAFGSIELIGLFYLHGYIWQ